MPPPPLPLGPLAGLGEAGREALAAARRDAPELLDAGVQQFSRPAALVAHGLAAHAVHPVAAVETGPPQDGVGRRGGHPERPGDAVRPPAAAAAQPEHGRGGVRRRDAGRAARARAAVAQAGLALVAVAAHPLARRGARDAEPPRRLGPGPAGLDLSHEAGARLQGQPCVRVGTRGASCRRRRSVTQRQQRGSSPVNNLPGNYSYAPAGGSPSPAAGGGNGGRGGASSSS